YMFFWITSQEVEEEEGHAGPDLDDDPVTAPLAERRRRIDVVTGMAYANLVFYFIILSNAATLWKGGIKIETADQAARALAPIVLVLLTLIARDRNVMGRHRNGWFDTTFGFLAAGAMAAAAVALIVVTLVG